MFVFRPKDLYDQAYIVERDGDWTDRSFVLPSGVEFSTPLHGMMWMALDGELVLLKRHVEC